jgi:hypothetical protein
MSFHLFFASRSHAFHTDDSESESMILRFSLLIYLSAILLAPGASASGDETPRSDSSTGLTGQVTIPYQDFKRLLQAATPATQEHNPEVAGAITRAQITLSFDPAHPSGEAEFDINTFGPKWVFVPFFGLGLPIINVACENAIVLPHDGQLCLFTDRSGLTKVTIEFDIQSAFAASGIEPISLCLLPATAGQLEFTDVPPGKRILVGGIFDRFYSLARPSTGKRSSGLGLCFAREVAQLHHGTVTVRNRRDHQGAEAVLALRAAPEHSA